MHRGALRPPSHRSAGRGVTCLLLFNPLQKETRMTWSTPQATDIRFGFEITMYAAAR
jgi:coenzyme PQQ precursor peptide PqqA